MSNSQTPKSLKHSRTLDSSSSSSSATAKSNLSSHMATVELKQRILSSLSKLSDRDTQQLAVEDLEKIIQTISPESLPMLLNCLFDSSNDPKPAVKKESLRLLPVVCHCHGELAATHLTKIVAHIVRRLRDADSGVREACRDAIGALSGQYLRGESGGGVLGVFVKPLFEAMGEQNKSVQSGAAICMAKMVECAIEPPQASFQKLCPRICKLLNNQNFLSKAALLPVVASLAQVGAIAPQSLESLLQSIHECLGNTDWATRKAAADTLSALALHSSNLIVDGAASTLAVLENCRFDKIKPVRDSMTEALQLWKKIAGKGDVSADDHDGDNPPQAEISEKNGLNNLNSNDEAAKNASDVSSPTSNPVLKGKGRIISDKAVVILKKKAPALTERVLNPEFFQKLETRGSGDLPVEVAVPRRNLNSSNSKNEEESSQTADSESRRKSNGTGTNQPEDFQGSSSTRYRNMERGSAGLRHNWPDNGKESRTRALDDDAIDANQRESQESFISNKGNWLAIQRQLSQLERQQVHLMNMLQDFMGGSHDGMVTLENRVRGLERIVEDMARNLSVSSGRKGGNFTSGYEGSSNRPLGKYNGFPDYGSPQYNGQDGAASGMRGRGPPWRPDMSDDYDFPAYGGSKNGLVGNRRGWSKGPGGPGPVRLGEGPSARSVWQNSKDEATLEAIRVAGEDVGGTSRNTRVPELEAEAMGDSNVAQERDPIWDSWSNALHSLQVGDTDSAFAEVASTGDDLLLVKLMDRSGPVLDQLSNEMANEVLHAIAQLTLEQDFFNICFLWIQQLAELVMENGSNVLGIPMELKKELLLSLHEVSAADSLEDWEGPMPNQLLIQLASAWGIEVQQFEK